MHSLSFAQLQSYDVGRLRSGSAMRAVPAAAGVDGLACRDLSEVLSLILLRGQAGCVRALR